MKILVYGAGVLGCELAHMMIKAGGEVSLLARGKWQKTLETEGLAIRHWAQLHTTVDHPRIVGELKPDDVYDLIFVVVQFTQLEDVLPIIAANKSRRVVLVGNNPEAEKSLRALTDCAYPKEVAFGFQGTAGHREKHRVVSIHVGKVGMTIGALHGHLSTSFQNKLEKAASSVYRLTWEMNMDAWLKCHLAFILPICYVCYITDGHLPRTKRSQINAIIDATIEAHQSLAKLHYPLRPDGEAEFFTSQRQRCFLMLWGMAKTPIGRLAASDHAMRAREEMSALDESFEALLQKSDIDMPNWAALSALGSPKNERAIGVFGVIRDGAVVREKVVHVSGALRDGEDRESEE